MTTAPAGSPAPTPGSGLATVVAPGRPATELTDEELESQGTQAHATRNWVFLHGTAEQFARHTSRMLELEQEYLHRHPHRTWQGSGGAPTGHGDEAAALREALRGIVLQLDALAAEPLHDAHPTARSVDPALAVLAAVAAGPGGRLHKLEVQQAAREARLDRAALAALYTGTDPLLTTDRSDRVLTDAGRARLRAAGRASGTTASDASSWTWLHQERPVWDEDKIRVVGGAPTGVFDLDPAPAEDLSGDWWAVAEDAPSGRVVAFGWMDVTWGEAEILLAVEPDAQQSGVGSFVLDHLEQEAVNRGLNYVYNTVRDTHPRHDEVADWLGVRGFRSTGDDGQLRKRVGRPAPEPARAATPSAAAAPVAAPAASAGADLGPGREDRGGYVDVEDQRY